MIPLLLFFKHVIVCLSTVSGAGRCEINNGGCWKKNKDGKTYSACSVNAPEPIFLSSDPLLLGSLLV